MKKIFSFIIIIVFVVCKLPAQNQAEYFELNQEIAAGSQVFEASDYILLKPGFRNRISTPQDSFLGMINPDLVFPPSGGLTDETIIVNFYPNPVDDGFHIDLPESGTIELFSILNQKVLEIQVNKGLNSSDISRLKSGTYLLKYTSKHLNASRVLIKH
jgi:hypothetical protein